MDIIITGKMPKELFTPAPLASLHDDPDVPPPPKTIESTGEWARVMSKPSGALYYHLIIIGCKACATGPCSVARDIIEREGL